MTNLTGQHALITGAGSGIGAAIARRMAAAGAHVSLAGRRSDRLKEVAKSIDNAKVYTLDVTDEAQVAKTVAAAGKAFGHITLLINSAGVTHSCALLKTSLKDWKHVLDVNLTGAFLCSRAVLAGMMAANFGRIVNIASTAGLKGFPYTAAYTAAKHGLVGLTRSLGKELARTSITVNAVCPGFTDTDMVEDAVTTIMKKTGRSREMAMEELLKTNPQHRLISPDEVAALTVWLCSGDADGITGLALPVSGGEIG